MKTTNFSKRMTKEQMIALARWARRLEADEMIIHTDGTITLTCEDGYICYNYRPTSQELKRR